MSKAVKGFKKLKDIRLQEGLSQVQMSVRIGVSVPTVIKLEAGEEVSDLIAAKVEKFLKEVAA